MNDGKYPNVQLVQMADFGPKLKIKLLSKKTNNIVSGQKYAYEYDVKFFKKYVFSTLRVAREETIHSTVLPKAVLNTSTPYVYVV